MPLKPIHKWAMLREKLTAAAKRQAETARHLEDVEVECEEFVQELIDGIETRDDGKKVSRERWEADMRKIASILVGNGTEFEIDDISYSNGGFGMERVSVRPGHSVYEAAYKAASIKASFQGDRLERFSKEAA